MSQRIIFSLVLTHHGWQNIEVYVTTLTCNSGTSMFELTAYLSTAFESYYVPVIEFVMPGSFIGNSSAHGEYQFGHSYVVCN